MNLNRSTLYLSLFAATQATAQTASDAMLEEVVVTAQRREERLQDVPAAITSLSGEDLSRQNLLGNADLAAKVPGLSLDVQGPGESTLSIRGVGTAYGLAPAVSYYLNETPLDIRTDGSTGVPGHRLLRRRSRGSAARPAGHAVWIQLDGRRVASPDGAAGPDRILRQGRDGRLDDGRRRTGYLGKAAVNVPLGDNAAIRFVGAYEHIPGYVDRAAPGDWYEPESGSRDQRPAHQRRRPVERAHPRPAADQRQPEDHAEHLVLGGRRGRSTRSTTRTCRSSPRPRPTPIPPTARP